MKIKLRDYLIHNKISYDYELIDVFIELMNKEIFRNSVFLKFINVGSSLLIDGCTFYIKEVYFEDLSLKPKRIQIELFELLELENLYKDYLEVLEFDVLSYQEFLDRDLSNWIEISKRNKKIDEICQK